MAGPTCSVFSAMPFGDYESRVLDELIHLTTSHKEGDSFWVNNTQTIGGSYRGDDRPFIFFIEQESREQKELDAIQSVFGWMPAFEIGLAAMCNDAVDHRILGEMAAWLAAKLPGLIDLSGSLPLPASAIGKMVRVPYDTTSGTELYYFIVDETLLREWLQSPLFVMMK